LCVTFLEEIPAKMLALRNIFHNAHVNCEAYVDGCWYTRTISSFVAGLCGKDFK